MVNASPLRSAQLGAGATFMSYGPARLGIEVVESFASYESEYAAIRKGVGIVEMPQRGVLEVTGDQRLDFLHRMVSHDVANLPAGRWRRAWLLNRKGRISAELILLACDSSLLGVLDRHQGEAVAEELNRFMFTEDVQVADRSSQYVHLSLHGPAASALIEAVAPDAGKPVAALEPDQHLALSIGGEPCRIYRHDQTGSLGLHLVVGSAGSAPVYAALAKATGGLVPAVTGGRRPKLAGRGLGWLAFNTARIEAGTPLYHIDFGPDSLPHETGILDQAVSFTKGCYLGQEVVARMHNLGHPKQVLTGLRFGDDRLPVAGSPVIGPDADRHDVIGAITSTTLSPMLGNVAIGLAMMRWGRHQPGMQVLVHAEGQRVPAMVQRLGFL